MYWGGGGGNTHTHTLSHIILPPQIVLVEIYHFPLISVG